MVTLKTVAEKAGVSPATVSRVINNTTGVYVASDTREKVMQAVELLHFVPNTSARSLRSNKTKNIALLIPDICNPAYPPTIQGVEEYARKANFNIILCITHNDLEIERYYIEKLKHSQVDGFLICSMTPQSGAVYQLKKDNIPTVLIARHYGEGIDAVVVDNYNGAYNAVKYLIRTGRKKIAAVSGNLSIPLYQQRLQGYKDALAAGDLPEDESLIVYETANKDALFQTVRDLIAQHPDIDAVFATSDEKAIITMRAIGASGYAVPRDIAVIGFDNIGISKLLNPPLTTTAQPFVEMGRVATQKLIDRIEGKNTGPAVVDVMKTELIIRESSD